MTAPLFGHPEVKKRAKKSDADPRHQPFIKFAFETYRERMGTGLILDGRSVKEFSDMLKQANPESLSLERLEQCWTKFLSEATEFDLRQPPLSWFVRTINRWLIERTEATSTDVVKDWMRRKLKP